MLDAVLVSVRSIASSISQTPAQVISCLHRHTRYIYS
jgi:hypothetical protein